jgi:hypothetical protein
MRTAWSIAALLLLIALLLPACGGQSPGPAAVLADADTLPGWSPAGGVQTFGKENLFDLVNGQADAYFAYAFEQVAVRAYENTDGASLRVELWELATAEDAYGLFTSCRSGPHLPIGNSGDADPGRRLVFWQERYFVRLLALQPLPGTDLLFLGETISAALPTGGQPPPLARWLPEAGLVEHSQVFFHEEISIQDRVWLGGENLLALGPETDGILARYELDDGLAQLILIQYPDAQAASSALEALQADSPEGLVAAQRRDTRLALVFGTANQRQVEQLLSNALDQE